MGKEAQSNSSGVTLTELLVVLVLVAVLLAMGAPAMSTMADSVRLTSGANTFFSSVLLARSEAAKRNGRVVLCKSSGGGCVSTGGWEQGWIVFHDANNNAALDWGEVLLLKEPGLSNGLRLRGNIQVADYVSYTPTGAARLTTGAFQAGTLTVCPQAATPVAARQIVISATGRPRTVKTMVDWCG
jgi:type IV fimbrial biogenesis protein FimT